MSLEFIMAGDTPATLEQKAFLKACNQLLQTGCTRFALAGWGNGDADIEGFSAFLERYRKAMPLEMLAPEVL